MKRLAILLTLVFFVGCVPTAKDYQDFSGKVTTLTNKIDDYQSEVKDFAGLLERDGVINEEIVAKLDKVNEEIDRIQPQVVEMAEAIKNADYVTGDDLGNVIKAAQAANTASTPFNPYAPLIDIGLKLLLGVTTIGAGGYAIKKTKDANKETAKRQADKQGRELTLREIAAFTDNPSAETVKSLMYKNIGNARAHNGV